jgi:L-threonylcarbamoyladenylate synthase
MPTIITIDPLCPDANTFAPAIDALRQGKVIAHPTETFYGLGVDALNEEAIHRIYEIKGREFSQPLLILISSPDVLGPYVTEVPPLARKLIDRYWPGPLTLIFHASALLPPLLCAHTDKVAVRVSPHSIAHALTSGFKGAITSTSANLSGAPSTVTAAEVLAQLGDTVDLIIDGGPTPGEKPSTIVDLTQSPPQLLREGAIPFEDLQPFF